MSSSKELLTIDRIVKNQRACAIRNNGVISCSSRGTCPFNT